MKKICIPALILSFYFPMFGYAASFDCAKAASTTEKLICSNETISKLDEQLATSYKAALEKSTDKTEFKKSQLEWLKQQRTCKDIACLNQLYQSRIDALNRVSIPQLLHSSSSISSGLKYTITKGKQFELCRVFNDYLNSQYHKPGDCHVGKYPPDSRLRSPEYKIIDANKYKDEIINYRVKRYSDVVDMKKYTERDFEMQLLHYWEITIDLDSDGVLDKLLLEKNLLKKDFEDSGCASVSSYGGNLFLLNGKKISYEWGEYPILGDPFWFDGKPYLLGKAPDYYIAEPNKNKAVAQSFPLTGICEFSNN